MFKLGFKTGIRAAYNVSDNPSFVAEPWYIYPAKHKSNGKIVSVFIFDKSKFESQVQRLYSSSSSIKNPKVIINESYEVIKAEVNQLSKLKHPQLLTIFEVLEETKTKFLFASEPVTDNLFTVNHSSLDELSIQKGLLQISKGLEFLHSHCSIIHLNIQPSSIFINNQGDWKLAGFRFLENLSEISPQERENFYIMNNSSMIPFANLNLNFTAPELIIDSHTKLDFANDIWSLGHLIYYLYNQDLLINCFDSNSISDYKQEFRKFEQKFYNHKPSELKYVLKNVPERLYPIFPQLLARYPDDRLTLNRFIDSDFFNGSIIKAMWFIDEFSTKAIDEKLLFMNGLMDIDPRTQASVIEQFPPAYRSSKLLPLLIDLLTNELNVLNESTGFDPNTEELICRSLDIILNISKTLSHLTFQDRVFSVLFKDDSRNKKAPKTFTKLVTSSVRCRLAVVDNLEIIQEKVNDKEFVDLIKKMLDLVLTTSPKEQEQIQYQIKLQETFLRFLPKIIEKIEFPFIKNTLFPMLCQVFKTTTILSTKLITIETFEIFVERKIIDKIIVNEQLFPVLRNLKSRDKRIVGKVLGFYSKLIQSEHISLDLESSVESVLPQCLALAFGCNDCSQMEFQNFISITDRIQKHLIAKKVSSLPKTSTSHMSVSNGNAKPTNFESLLQTQVIHESPKELPGPKSMSVMQPMRKSNDSSGSNSPKVSNSPVFRRSNQPNRSSPQHTAPVTLKPRSRTTTPVTLKPMQPNKPSSQPGLKFGATNQATNASNTKLLNALKSTFDRPNNADDDFDDFQSAGNESSTSVNSSQLNWQTEMNKTKATNTSGSTYNTQQHVMNPVRNPPVNTNNASYPPGFNSNMILAPKSSGSPALSHSQPQKSQQQSSHVNPDLLNLL
ncbi:ppk32 [[Candida] subhashii]|uniref:Ppk32 n=1 Tax=[Candida] subhashii TaxID=561895 RepID=A0A8J5UJ34_9ASCO|nr:ppk32 [[Candida] subhashii]KAG7660751.1 ppk32 [[Candida] subhashii]